ncbi:prolipoprotein diacylglyceryl transferase [Nonomuraea solani]|uniref:Phosphatidylglycerol--prolipoprotein diacylglyceryl transferase n=1 Tax=Nonomuraea solani TaxID=1144553 RepID=A0A1H6DD68_9ACTN|nr:prolipoprotein diacylglyceryl transferase [Nonomuraea solani]SEG83407.1 prolipoprotein diacylglyceryl transferase [Nonomuraea solani]
MPLASIPSPSEGVWYLGFIPIRAYALCIVLGVIVAVWLSERRWRARGGQAGTIIDIAVPAVIFGLIGGRLYHVITDWQTYFGSRAIKEPYRALFIWEGGLGIWGAIALGGVGVWLSVRKRGISMGAIADTVAPGIAFAQAIGRWGNWFNQELYGSPTTLPWGLEIDLDHGGEPGVLYHPTFLYESLWDVALGFVLILVGRRFALHHGRLFALYVAGYTLGRFWIEGLRIDPVGGVDHAVLFLGLRINQWTSIVLFLGAIFYFWATRNKDGVEVLVPPSEDPDPAHSSGQADPATSDVTDGETAVAPAESGEATAPPETEKPKAEAAEAASAEAETAEAGVAGAETAEDETAAAATSKPEASASKPAASEAEAPATEEPEAETPAAQEAEAETAAAQEPEAETPAPQTAEKTSDAEAAAAQTADTEEAAVKKEKNSR